MSYIKFEAPHLHDDRWLEVSPAAFVVHVWALSYANEQATDGLISKPRASRLVCPVDPAELAAAWAQLVAVGLWEDTGDGYFCGTFTAHGIAAAEQSETRAKWSADKRRRRLHLVGNHSLCKSPTCKAVHVSTGGQVDTSTEDKWTTRPDPTRPDPTQPEGLGSESGWRAGTPSNSAGATPEGSPEVVHKHHDAPGCCGVSGNPTNRYHYKLGECDGCDHPVHSSAA